MAKTPLPFTRIVALPFSAVRADQAGGAALSLNVLKGTTYTAAPGKACPSASWTSTSTASSPGAELHCALSGFGYSITPWQEVQGTDAHPATAKTPMTTRGHSSPLF